MFFLLIIGFFVFQHQNERSFEQANINLKNIENKIILAESQLILNNTTETSLNLTEVLKEITPLTKAGVSVNKDAKKLKERIEKSLYEINKIEIIENPENIFEIKDKQFSSQNIFNVRGTLYLFSQYSQNVIKVLSKSKTQEISLLQKANMARSWYDSIFFLQKPNTIYILKDDKVSGPYNFEYSTEETNFDDLFVFFSNLYFLDKSKDKIIKYSSITDTTWAKPESWISQWTEGFTNAESIAIDGSAWVLSNNIIPPSKNEGAVLESKINRYYGGFFQESIKINTFPVLETPTKIFSKLDNLYILDPTQKRILILTKQGKIIKQFKSEKFENLKDFTISDDGKTIYLLSGSKVFQISF